MAKLILDDVGNLNTAGLTTINSNSDKIEAALEKTLSRDGTSPNQMTADFDMNHNDILNVDNLDVQGSFVLDGEVVHPETIVVTGAVLKTDTDASGFGFVVDEDTMVSDSDKKLPTQQSVKAYVDNGTVSKVASRVLLAGVNSTKHPVVYLDDNGRSGMFVWNSSDLSANVTSDTQQGIYVAPTSDTTGASGAWVRQHNGIKDLLWFGATGDGTTDDYNAIAAWIDTLPFFECYAPAGTYRSSSAITRTFSSANESDRISIRGAGREATFFLFDSGSAGGFVFTYTTVGSGLPGNHNYASFVDMACMAGGTANGKGIHVEAQNGAYVTTNFENLKLGRQNNTAYWDIGISVDSISVVFFNKLLGDSTNYNGRFIQIAATYAHVVEYNISNVHCSGWDISVALEGLTYGIEGLNVSSSSLIACNKGIYADNSSSPGNYPQITWHGLHLNANVACIHAKNFAQIGGTAGLFYIQNTASVTTDGLLLEYTGVAGSSTTMIRGTVIQALGTQSGSTASTGVRFTGSIFDVTVDVTVSNCNTGVSAPSGIGCHITEGSRFNSCGTRSSGFTNTGVVSDATRVNSDHGMTYENFNGTHYSIDKARLSMRVQSQSMTVANATKDTATVTFDKAFNNGCIAAFASLNTDPGAGVTYGLSGSTASQITFWIRGATVSTVVGFTVCSFGY